MPYLADFGIFQCLILQIFELSNALFCILGFLCEFIECMEHHVAVDGVVPCLGAALLIDGATDVLDAVEDIKAVDNESELAVEETP